MKSGEDGRNPWYDMGRLDTYEKQHLEKYEAEYYITVRWKNHDSPCVINVYLEPAHFSVGYRQSYNGVLFRPYDGKIRPKSWDDFDSGKTYWADKESFQKGLRASKMFRRMLFISEWYKDMPLEQRKKIKRLFDEIDAKKQVTLFDDVDE